MEHKEHSSRRFRQPILNSEYAEVGRLRLYWLSSIGLALALFGGLLYYGFFIYTDVSFTLGQVESVILQQVPRKRSVIDFDRYLTVSGHSDMDHKFGAEGVPLERNPFFHTPILVEQSETSEEEVL